MTVSRWHLAQANIAPMKAPIEDPLMERFRLQLDRINAVADASPGFVWRLQTEGGNSTDIRAFEDPLVLFNMSVWEDMEALHGYTYRGEHRGPLRDRREWFDKAEGPSFVLWWIPAGHTPTIDEAKAKLALLAERGPSPDAFTFRNPFPKPDAGRPAAEPIDEGCDWT